MEGSGAGGAIHAEHRGGPVQAQARLDEAAVERSVVAVNQQHKGYRKGKVGVDLADTKTGTQFLGRRLFYNQTIGPIKALQNLAVLSFRRTNIKFMSFATRLSRGSR